MKTVLLTTACGCSRVMTVDDSCQEVIIPIMTGASDPFIDDPTPRTVINRVFRWNGMDYEPDIQLFNEVLRVACEEVV